ncbi:uncharacterized protein TNCV_3307101 [Trichonephila clavipes]|nr:uncharacterized protein TNCV_3307101 [Trichonephila clavipes]
MRICDRWMQEGTKNRRGPLHPPQCNTSREDSQIVHMAVTDRSVRSRTIVQYIESVRIIQCLRVPFDAIYSRVVCPQDVSTANGAMKEGGGWQNGMKLSLLTNHASVCNTTMVRLRSGDTVERGC